MILVAQPTRRTSLNAPPLQLITAYIPFLGQRKRRMSALFGSVSFPFGTRSPHAPYSPRLRRGCRNVPLNFYTYQGTVQSPRWIPELTCGFEWGSGAFTGSG